MRNVRIALAFAVLIAAVMSTGAAESDPFLNITNETGFTIATLQISDAASEDWGDDILGGNPLLQGESIRVPVSSLSSAIVSVRGRDDEGDTYTVREIDAGSEDVTITLADIDPD